MKKSKLAFVFFSSLLTTFLFTACNKEVATDIAPDTSTPVVKEEEDVTQAPTIPTEEAYLLSIDNNQQHEISDMLYGLFLEDINFTVDGGIYGEMIKNRSFEYGSMASAGYKHGWSVLGDLDFQVVDGSLNQTYLNSNNPSYARITNTTDVEASISNSGFLDGMAINNDLTYDFSVFLRNPSNLSEITLRLENEYGTIYGESLLSITPNKNEWWKYETTITSNAGAAEDVHLSITMKKGSLDLDMVSLFPETYKDRDNGLRKDLGEQLEALTPKFLRFPGGCVVEGEGLHNAYSWKDSIGDGMSFNINGETTFGDVATRPIAENIWGNQNSATPHPYYMTYGIGFYEYFLLCEDLGASPIPIVNAGLSCLIQGTRSVGTPADAVEIGSEEFQQYVQDALDLVEFCRGDESTKWGAIRIAMGHAQPFELTYIGIGNEQWGSIYFNRYEAFKAAFNEAAKAKPDLYGDIKLIVANGPIASDQHAWNHIKQKGADYAGLVDEHYYMTPSWFLLNTKRYDSYDRSSTPVFLGEYAAKSNTAEAALAEAAFMTGIERNGDIVSLASYAPLFGNTTNSQWTPDLIWFNNEDVWGSPNYYVQKMFSNHVSDRILSSTLSGNNLSSKVQLRGKVGVGTWMTNASFDNILVTDTASGDILYQESFDKENLDKESSEGWEEIEGTWSLKDGTYLQSNAGNPRNNITGDVSYVGDSNWTNYTLTLTATKHSGSEGFLIPIAVKDKNNFFHWNIGGWNNTISCLEQTIGGSKSGQIAETVKDIKIENGVTYEIKIMVQDNTISCFLNEQRYITYVIPETEAVYQVAGIDEDQNLIIKLVNVTDQVQKVKLDLQNFPRISGNGTLSLLQAETLGDMNIEKETEKMKTIESSIQLNHEGIYEAPKYSVSIITLPMQ